MSNISIERNRFSSVSFFLPNSFSSLLWPWAVKGRFTYYCKNVGSISAHLTYGNHAPAPAPAPQTASGWSIWHGTMCHGYPTFIWMYESDLYRVRTWVHTTQYDDLTLICSSCLLCQDFPWSPNQDPLLVVPGIKRGKSHQVKQHSTPHPTPFPLLYWT